MSRPCEQNIYKSWHTLSGVILYPKTNGDCLLLISEK